MGNHSLLAVPILHVSHAVDPAAVLYVPPGHVRQVEAPARVVYVPVPRTKCEKVSIKQATREKTHLAGIARRSRCSRSPAGQSTCPACSWCRTSSLIIAYTCRAGSWCTRCGQERARPWRTCQAGSSCTRSRLQRSRFPQCSWCTRCCLAWRRCRRDRPGSRCWQRRMCR